MLYRINFLKSIFVIQLMKYLIKGFFVYFKTVYIIRLFLTQAATNSFEQFNQF